MGILKKLIIFFVSGFIQGLLFFIILYIECISNFSSRASTLLFFIGGIVTSVLFLIFIIYTQQKLKLKTFSSIVYPLFTWIVSCIVMFLLLRNYMPKLYPEGLNPGLGLMILYYYVFFHSLSIAAIIISIIVRFIRNIKNYDKLIKTENSTKKKWYEIWK